jgi:signal transduction histidine kinase
MISAETLTAVYGGVYIGTALLTAGLAYWVLRTEMSSRRWLGGLMVVLSAWAVVSATSVLVDSRAVHRLLTVAWVASGLTTVLAWFGFVADYTGRNPRENTVFRLFGAVYLGLLAFGLTIPFHDLYYASTTLQSDPFPHVTTTIGPVRVVALGYTFAGVGLGAYYLWELFTSARYHSKTQPFVLVAGILVGLTPSVASRAGLTPVPTYDHTALGISVFVFVITYAVFKHSFADLAPIARDVVVERLGDPLFVLDSDARLVDYNDAAQHIAPALDADSVGNDVSEFVPELGAVPVAGEDHPDEVTLTVDGETRYYSVRVSTVDGPSPMGGYAVLLRDVTERRERERELEVAREELERSNDRLEEFASVVSHDLRNPLNVAALRVDLARETTDSEHLDRAAQAHDRMETLIDDLLQLARTGEHVDERSEVSLAEFVSSCWHTVETGDGTLLVDCDRVLRVDPDRFRQLLENLFRNATDHGPRDVTVTVGGLPNGFYVADDGPGIPDSDRDQVLDRGYSTADEGTGLGLAIVEAIADAHGWEVTVTESEDGGARFEFTGADLVTRETCSA